MNIQLLFNRVINDPDTIIRPGRILTKQEIDNDKYLTSAYYLHNDSIRLVTPTHLLSDHINGRPYARVQRGVDITQYAYDFILEQGRALIFLQQGLDYSILMSLKDKKFLTFGDHRQIPFGISNFISPRPNDLSITEQFTYGKPILIVEGLRDCLDVQTIYPYTLAMQTAAIPKMVQEVLSTLTSTLILAFDNDPAGLKALAKSRYLPFDTKQFQYPANYKDFGTLSEIYLKDPYNYQWYRTFICNQLSVLTEV